MQTKIFILIVILLTSMSCKKEEQVIQQEEQQKGYREYSAGVNETTLPQTMLYGDTISFEIKFYVSGSCGKFSRLDDTFQDKTHTIKVYKKYNDSCESSLPAVFTRTVNYSFTPTLKGAYLFKFWQNDNSYLIDTLIVQ